ncbi:MAG: hypothetical protein R3F51_14365 [Cyanobacteriota/Melainabacteria group bacterium]
MLKKLLAVPLSLTVVYSLAMANIAVGPVWASAGHGASSKDEAAETSFEKAMAMKKEGNTGGALLELIKVVNANPQMVEAYYQQALIFKEQNLLKLAASRLEQAIAIDPEFKKGRVLLATIAIEQGDVGEAFKQLGKSLEKKTEETPDTKDNTTILQQIHSGLPPANTKKTQVASSDSKNSNASNSSKKIKKEKPVSRKRIRSIIARRYKRFDKVYRNPRRSKPWYARYTRMLTWATPFKFHRDKNSSNSQSPLLVTDPQESDLSNRNIEKQPAPKVEELTARADSLEQPIYKSPRSKKEEKALDTILGSARVSSTDLVAPALGLADILAPENKLKENESLSEATGQEKVVSMDEPAPTTQTKLLAEEPVAEPEKKPFSPPIQDKWTEKLTLLNKNGTGSLKKGEAFMFSEDTGEAVLFLSDGSKIRRIIAPKQSAEQIVKLRRPDVLVPKELLYDTSLLGKVVNRTTPKSSFRTSSPKSNVNSSPILDNNPNETPPTFHMEKLMDDSRTFIGVIRDALRL